MIQKSPLNEVISVTLLELFPIKAGCESIPLPTEFDMLTVIMSNK